MTNHRTYGGEIRESDFSFEPYPPGTFARRCVDAAVFDQLCVLQATVCAENTFDVTSNCPGNENSQGHH